ncbi:MAG: hypothetical protein NTV94_15375 [Planctomycetota bacterium]|nr:hypothetical protein [Planctomycetota bacterium]
MDKSLFSCRLRHESSPHALQGHTPQATAISDYLQDSLCPLPHHLLLDADPGGALHVILDPELTLRFGNGFEIWRGPSAGTFSTVTINSPENIGIEYSDDFISIVYLPCPADFNLDAGIDFADIDAFFIDWESGDLHADVNRDGGVDGDDVAQFFAVWENGGCRRR